MSDLAFLARRPVTPACACALCVTWILVTCISPRASKATLKQQQQKPCHHLDPFHISHNTKICPFSLTVQQRTAVILGLKQQMILGKILALTLCQVPAQWCKCGRFNHRNLQTPELPTMRVYHQFSIFQPLSPVLIKIAMYILYLVSLSLKTDKIPTFFFFVFEWNTISSISYYLPWANAVLELRKHCARIKKILRNFSLEFWDTMWKILRRVFNKTVSFITKNLFYTAAELKWR